MTQAAILAASGSPGTTTGFKNRIINGWMLIDQRNSGASVTNTVSNSLFCLDRWNIPASQASKFTIQQNAGSVTPPAGFANYAGVTSSSSYALVSSDYFLFRQAVEGYNVSDLNWGTANAKTVTLSFWVYSSLTGSFGGSIQNANVSRSYPFSYTISAANTWTQISVTIPGDTTGTWVGATNGNGMYVTFGLGVASNLSGTAGAWVGSNAFVPTSSVSVVSTSGATWYVTGIQFEVGTTATNFDFRSYGTELALCQRYFETSYSVGTAVGAASVIGLKYSSASAGANTTGYLADGIIYQVAKRAIPTITLYDNAGNSGKLNRENIGVGTTNNVASNISPIASSTCFIYTSGSATANGISYQYAISAEL